MNSCHLYFAYGSNMDTEQMISRCPSATKLLRGYLINYDLAFNRKGSYRSGGVASVVSRQGRKVHGVIYQISEADLEEMDRIEDPDAYYRETLSVWVDQIQSIDCQVYISYPQGGDFTPDPDYLELIIRSAKTAQLPKSYIQRMTRFRI